MKDFEHQGRDKFVPENVTVSVTVKPKKIYPSNVSNWENDRYVATLNFREEHEVSASCGSILEITDAIWKTLIFLRDSLFQFEIMNEYNW